MHYKTMPKTQPLQVFVADNQLNKSVYFDTKTPFLDSNNKRHSFIQNLW